eukprot:CFRG2455T1
MCVWEKVLSCLVLSQVVSSSAVRLNSASNIESGSTHTLVSGGALCVNLKDAAKVKVISKDTNLVVGVDTHAFEGKSDTEKLRLQMDRALDEYEKELDAKHWKCPNGYKVAAAGYFADRVEEIGWGMLRLSDVYSSDDTTFAEVSDITNNAEATFSDSTRAYAVGFMEGYLSHHRIEQNINNTVRNMGKLPRHVAQFLRDQLLWTRSQVKKHPNDIYWKTIGVIQAQFDGMVLGYVAGNTNTDKQHAELGLAYINSNNEVGDLKEHWLRDGGHNEEKTKPWHEEYDKQETVTRLSMMSCSAFIRLLPDHSDLLTAHATWRPFSGMLRVFKTYRIHVDEKPFVQTMSASPGCVSSHDDFYMTNRGLAIVETTNGMYNESYIRRHIKVEALMTFHRASVANILGTTGQEWVDAFSKNNPALYPNQWMIVDYNLFTPGDTDLKPFTLTVTEQLPDRMITADGTNRLQKNGFWPSYNIPYFEVVYRLSGYPSKLDKLGDEFSYKNCPRAKIFEREAPKVLSVEDAKHLIRYNEWQTDPLSLHEARNSIASRYDLSATNAKPFGAVDGKVTSFALMKKLRAHAVCGPTYQDQEVFQWSTSEYASTAHEGVPDRFDFPWVNITIGFH